MSNFELKGLRNLQGLDSLIAQSKSAEFSKETYFNLPVGLLISGKYQPRTDIDQNDLNELVSSIKSQGILLPLIVRKINEEKFEIIAGERRWRAAKLVGLSTVPAIIREVSDETALAFALIENLQREGLNPIDEALAFSRLRDEFSLTHEEISERVGRSRSAVTNLIRLLVLNDFVKDMLRAGKIEMGHARALLSLDEKNQQEIAQLVINKNLSVRETEKLVQDYKSQPHMQIPNENKYGDQVKNWEQRLTEKLSANVKVMLNSKGEGRVVIRVHSPDEIEWIIDSFK
jgi:ParB family chromosome partitioning protein